MIINVRRIHSDNDATLSVISVDGDFQCFGLEDEYRADKTPGETRIPAGIYRVGLRTVGGFHNRYRSKFGAWHEGMLEIQDVPNFEHILIHIGNTDQDTDGCLLVGCGAMSCGEITVQSSRVAYGKLYERVLRSCKEGKLLINFEDADR